MEFVKDERPGIRHVCDLHAKIANPQLFAEALSYDELSVRAVDVPGLGGGIRALGPVDALLLACIHRVAHHNDCEKLLWIYDIHLLATGMDRATLEHVAECAAEKGIRAVCRRGLGLAHHWFHTDVPSDVVRALASVDAVEPSAAYLGGRLRPVDVLWSDLKTMGRWRDRWRLVREHLFPPARYMRERYGVSNALFLPALYVHRGGRGARSWFGRPQLDES